MVKFVCYVILPLESDLFYGSHDSLSVKLVPLVSACQFVSLEEAVEVSNYLNQYTDDVYVIGRYVIDGEGECVYVI